MNEKTNLRFPHFRNLIGICGNAGHGKNTVANILRDCLQPDNFIEQAFASRIKPLAHELFDWYGSEYPDKTALAFEQLTWRGAYQKMGTAIKQAFGSHIFVALTDQGLCNFNDNIMSSDQANAITDCVITDVRFQYEADWIINNYGTVILVRNPRVSIDLSHESELFPFRFHGYPKLHTHRQQVMIVENSGTLEDLATRVHDVALGIAPRTAILQSHLKMIEKQAEAQAELETLERAAAARGLTLSD